MHDSVHVGHSVCFLSRVCLWETWHTLSLSADTVHEQQQLSCFSSLICWALCGTKYHKFNIFYFNFLHNSSVLEAILQKSWIDLWFFHIFLLFKPNFFSRLVVIVMTGFPGPPGQTLENVLKPPWGFSKSVCELQSLACMWQDSWTSLKNLQDLNSPWTFSPSASVIRKFSDVQFPPISLSWKLSWLKQFNQKKIVF